MTVEHERVQGVPDQYFPGWEHWNELGWDPSSMGEALFRLVPQ